MKSSNQKLMALAAPLRIVIAAIALCIAVSLVGLASSPAVADEAATGFVSGTVWMDLNRNGIREPAEPLMGHSAVYLQAAGMSAASGATVTTYTEPDGTYLFDAVAQGEYVVFSTTSQAQTISIADANAAVSADIPVSGHQVFLPLTIK